MQEVSPNAGSVLKEMMCTLGLKGRWTVLHEGARGSDVGPPRLMLLILLCLSFPRECSLTEEFGQAKACQASFQKLILSTGFPVTFLQEGKTYTLHYSCSPSSFPKSCSPEEGKPPGPGLGALLEGDFQQTEKRICLKSIKYEATLRAITWQEHSSSFKFPTGDPFLKIGGKYPP